MCPNVVLAVCVCVCLSRMDAQIIIIVIIIKIEQQQRIRYVKFAGFFVHTSYAFHALGELKVDLLLRAGNGLFMEIACGRWFLFQPRTNARAYKSPKHEGREVNGRMGDYK